MFKFSRKHHFDDSTFLPEDYVERKAERRTNVLSVTLFVVVTMGVIAAFFVTNRQWNDVKHYQHAINIRYTQAAKNIEQLKLLEEQKNDLLHKAELTTALIEKVPRSILLSELINRMPKNRIVLLEFEMKSKRLDRPSVTRPTRKAASAKTRSLADKAARQAVRAREKEEASTVRAPRFETALVIVGVAPRHRDIAHYVAALQDCELIDRVELIFTEATKIKEREMNKFRIEADLRTNADARRIIPLETPRLDNITELEAPDPADLLNMNRNLFGSASDAPSPEDR